VNRDVGIAYSRAHKGAGTRCDEYRYARARPPLSTTGIGATGCEAMGTRRMGTKEGGGVRRRMKDERQQADATMVARFRRRKVSETTGILSKGVESSYAHSLHSLYPPERRADRQC
jgi:hypothetical protein